MAENPTIFVSSFQSSLENLSVINLNSNSRRNSTFRRSSKVSRILKSQRRKSKPESRFKKILASTEIIIVSLVFIFFASFVFFSYYTFFRNNSKVSEEYQNQTQSEGEGCDFVTIVGDDICDDIANTEVCAYDFGDCCNVANDRSTCQDCFCHIDTTLQTTFTQFLWSCPFAKNERRKKNYKREARVFASGTAMSHTVLVIVDSPEM